MISNQVLEIVVTSEELSEIKPPLEKNQMKFKNGDSKVRKKEYIPVAFSEHDRFWLQDSALHNGCGVIHFQSPIR